MIAVQIVAENRGTEEYVHLKSLEDEYEYSESNMPKRQTSEGEEAGAKDHEHVEQEGHDSSHQGPDRPEPDVLPSPDSRVEDDDDADYPEHWRQQYHSHDPFAPAGAESPTKRNFHGSADSNSQTRAGRPKYEWGQPRFSTEWPTGTGDSEPKESMGRSNAECKNDLLGGDDKPRSDDGIDGGDDDDPGVKEALESHKEYLRRQRERLFAPKSPVNVDVDVPKESSNDASNSGLARNGSSKWSNDDID
jgi:hypothetical protein